MFSLKMIRPVSSIAVAVMCSAYAQDLPALKVLEPTKIEVSSVSSPSGSYSGNHSIKQAIDGDFTTPNWHVPGKNEVEGEFVFDQPVAFDYIIFHNANFNDVELEVKSKGEWKKQGKFELGSAKMIRFPKGLKDVEAVRMKMLKVSGFGVREIEFFAKAKDPHAAALKKVFTDSSCTSLKKNAKKEDAAALPPFYRELAKQLKSGKYGTALDREFRMQDYKAFTDPDYVATVRKTNALSPLDNPTGIYAEEGEEIIVLVGPTGGIPVSLASVAPHGINSSTYPLEEGVNKIKIARTGLLYVMYNSGDKASNKSVKVHIPVGQGKVNGYFDIKKHKDADYKRMIAKAPAAMFDLVGVESMMILDTEMLRKWSPDAIKTSVEVWDESVRAMWKIMGYEKYPKPHNNRQLGVATVGGAHMFAGWYYCGYSIGNEGYNMRNEVIAPGVLEGKRIWGIGHEVGHCYQHPINWRSMTESSNNFFAQLILDEVIIPRTKNEQATDNENPCKYLLEEIVKGKPFHDINGWAKWGFAQYSFYLYFHKLGIDTDFYPDFFESLRKKPLTDDAVNVEKAHLAWYERICDHAKLDFTEDFETFNWFVPIDHQGNQYGQYSFKMTKAMADASKERIKAKNYPKPKYRVAFMHHHGKVVDLWGLKLKGSELNGYWTKFKADGKLSASVKASKSGNRLVVTDGENAAAFCVKTDGKIVGYYDRPQFDIGNDVPWNATSEVYAIPMQTAEPYKLIFKEGK